MIIGQKVALRALEKEDLKKVHQWKNDSEFMKYDRFAPEYVQSFVELEKEYQKQLEGEQKNWKTYIILKKPKEAIGMVSYRYWGKKARTADIGIGLGEKKYWGKGYGTEALRLILDVVFNQMDFHKAELTTLAENERALKCFKKYGFKVEGRFREEVYFDGKYHDLIQMGLLKNEYKG